MWTISVIWYVKWPVDESWERDYGDQGANICQICQEWEQYKVGVAQDKKQRRAAAHTVIVSAGNLFHCPVDAVNNATTPPASPHRTVDQVKLVTGCNCV